MLEEAISLVTYNLKRRCIASGKKKWRRVTVHEIQAAIYPKCNII